MKGKVSMYFNAQNVGKVRSRIENQPKEFTANMRAAIQEVTVEILNESMQKVRSALIVKFQEMGLTLKDAKYAAQIANPLNPFFDVVYSSTPFSGADEEENPEPEAAPAGDKSDEFED